MTQLSEQSRDVTYTSKDTSARDDALPGNAVGLDQLDYMADMIGELEKIAHDAQMHTLAGLLALAQVEARRNLTP